MAQQLRLSTILMVILGWICVTGARAEDELKYSKAKFTGSPSCSSTSCHGGGTLHNESIIYEKKDKHAFASGILEKGTSRRICEALGIVGDPGKAAQCNICHSPMQAVPPERLVKDVKAELGVGCEACHGPAEPWLRFHTRRDVNFEQLVTAGLRDMNDIYGRANVCVACHLNLDESIRNAGHPELNFELDGYSIEQPPHYIDKRPSLGPRSWLTGQAAALRELSWKLAAKRDERLVARWKALVWLLRKTESGKGELPEIADFAAMQSAADRLARTAARNTWTKNQVSTLLKDYVSLHAEFNAPKSDKVELRRRAEVLAMAIDRLWEALKKEGGTDSAAFELVLNDTYKLSREQDDFDSSAFARSLEKLEAAFNRLPKP